VAILERLDAAAPNQRPGPAFANAISTTMPTPPLSLPFARVYAALLFLALMTSSSAAFAADLPSSAASAADPPASAGSSESNASSTPAADDDAAFVPAEPEFRLINLPTTMRLPRFKGNFDLTHRFAGNFRRGSFSDQASRLFGIDDGAVVGFEYRFGVAPHVQAAVFRTAFNRTIQFHGKWDGIRQGGSRPISASLVVSIEGQDNFQEQYAPAVGVSLSRMFGDIAAVYAVPMFVHNTASVLGIDDDTTFVGIGARVQIVPTVYVAGEISPRLSGFRPGTKQFGFAVEKRIGGHVFQLNVTNGSGTTLAQVARGGQLKNLGLGFNLARKFF
jgi:hypothetical protein